MSACLRYTRRVWESLLRNQGHDAQCIPSLVVTRAVPGTVEASIRIEKYNLNRAQSLHGGLILSLTDTIGSLAVATKGQYMTGVSTDISATFLKPAGTTGDTIFMKGTLDSMGKTLAYTRVEFTNASGKLVAFGHHTKFIGATLNHEKNVTFSADGESVLSGDENV
ncbi:hypothetical protein BOTBODRAFT_133267 [Botryobasidium botryosum FD-172 SS1]|uniref:Thioesterase domain-containing protein n=1 Tax=Botryobasidium botryosum (strain FD-172 SS1) TaxID=930990 RepID=A0A067MD71_BOTB1|nr:hypothetical protein BOTBODRAFT_133267 [Botryobasidium botryosum FD-172 SS1]